MSRLSARHPVKAKCITQLARKLNRLQPIRWPTVYKLRVHRVYSGPVVLPVFAATAANQDQINFAPRHNLLGNTSSAAPKNLQCVFERLRITIRRADDIVRCQPNHH